MRFRKIAENGALLSDDSTDWVAVLDTSTKLMWTVREGEDLDEMPWATACAIPATLRTAGFSDWRMPTVDELFMLADRTAIGPAIDTAYFPKCKVGLYWTGTEAAAWAAVHSAWYVEFDLGGVDWSSKTDVGYVRAVRDHAR